MVLCAGHVGLSDTSERGCPYTSCRVRHPNLLAALEASPGPTTGALARATPGSLARWCCQHDRASSLILRVRRLRQGARGRLRLRALPGPNRRSASTSEAGCAGGW